MQSISTKTHSFSDHDRRLLIAFEISVFAVASIARANSSRFMGTRMTEELNESFRYQEAGSRGKFIALVLN